MNFDEKVYKVTSNGSLPQPERKIRDQRQAIILIS
jgi:hypothetical protein